MDVYQKLIRPLLFLLPGEQAHEIGKKVFRNPLMRRILAPGAVTDPRLAVQLGGLRVANPVGLSAGFDKDAELVDALQDFGFGYLVFGTIMPHVRSGNPGPRIVRYPEREAMVNCLGLPSKGLEHAVSVLRRRRPGAIPVVASFGANELDDYIRCFEALQPVADATEVNLRCPNARDDDGEFQEMQAFTALLDALCARKTKPLFVKFPIINSQQEEDVILALVERCLQYDVDAVTITGAWTVPDERLSVGKGTLTGKPVIGRTIELTRKVYGILQGRIAIKARGGVASGRDAFAVIAAGADSVDILTAVVYQGWSVAARINRELAALLEAKGISSVRELRGSEQRIGSEPEQEETVQVAFGDSRDVSHPRAG